MSTWYYATGDRQRHGPLDAAALKALFDAGSIDRRTLVWHEGDAQWQPLSAHAAALGLATGGPPPLDAVPAGPTAPPPGLSKRSGCAIFGIAAAAAGTALLGVIGILAAVALPAYHDYVLRSKAGAAIAQARGYQPQVLDFLEREGSCPGNDDAGFGPAEDHAGGALSAVTFGMFEGSDRCGLEATIAAPGDDALDQGTIWLEYERETGSWDCSSDIPDKLLPIECRG